MNLYLDNSAFCVFAGSLERPSLAFTHYDQRLIAKTPTQLNELFELLATNHTKNTWIILYLSFEAGLSLAGLSPQKMDGPLAIAYFAKPTQSHQQQLVELPKTQWQPTITIEQYQKQFEQIQAAIVAGDMYQINLTFRLHSQTKPQWTSTHINQLPTCSVLLNDPELRLWSLSPESFLSITGKTGQIMTSPIKGTITPQTSFAKLQTNSKEQAEHTMVVDMARNDLGRVCQPGTVYVKDFAQPLRLTYATHMVSHICGQLLSGLSFKRILQATMPAASISGTPKINALNYIQAIETTARGPYTGTIGYISPFGDAHFSLLIRTAWQKASDSFMSYGTGGGIVADSLWLHEWQEALLKTKPFQSGDVKPL